MSYFFENVLQTLQGSRFRYGAQDPATEFDIELDKRLIQAYIDKFSSSENPEKKENARILGSVMSGSTNQVDKFSPRRNPWETEFERIYDRSNITFDMAYKAAIDAIYCEKELGLDPAANSDKEYYTPTLVVQAEVFQEAINSLDKSR